MPDIITDYTLREEFDFMNSPQKGSNHKPEEIDRLLDQLLADIPESGMFDEGYVIKYQGIPLTPVEAFERIEPHLPRIKMNALYMFEDYFKNGTDIDRVIRDYESGDKDARRVMRYMGIFPIEAMNIRTELAFPQLMSLRASETGNKRGFFVYRQISAALGLEFQVIEGPHLPPMNTRRLVDHLKVSMPIIDRMTRNIITNGGKPTMKMS